MGSPFIAPGLSLAPASLLDSARKAAEQLQAEPAKRATVEADIDGTGVRGEVAVRVAKGLTFGVAGQFGFAKTAERRIAAKLKGAW